MSKLYETPAPLNQISKALQISSIGTLCYGVKQDLYSKTCRKNARHSVSLFTSQDTFFRSSASCIILLEIRSTDADIPSYHCNTSITACCLFGQQLNRSEIAAETHVELRCARVHEQVLVQLQTRVEHVVLILDHQEIRHPRQQHHPHDRR